MVEMNRAMTQRTCGGSCSTAPPVENRTPGRLAIPRRATGSRSGWSTSSASDHPMHHPFHIHGAGRFLVLARDGAPEPNLMWKDTVLIRTGETVDILFDVTHPGVWMAHCHIAEHMHSGMMFEFTVTAEGPS